MNRNIIIYFNGKNIKKYIKNSEELVIKNESFKIKKVQFSDTTYRFKICIDSQEKICTLNNLFDFFIKHKCFFCEHMSSLFDIDKDLFYKCGYWFLNSKEYWNSYPPEVFNYLALAYNDKVVKYIECMIDDNNIGEISVRMDLDLGIIDFLVNKCKSELSKEKYDKFLERLIFSAYSYRRLIIRNYGINFFKRIRKNNILLPFLNYPRNECICLIVIESIETNQTEIIDYFLKYGIEKDKVKLEDHQYELLISLIKNDNTETFMYTIQNVSISDILIQNMIERSGEFITKEYIEILLNNGKLDLNNLELLEKSIKNNPDTKLKKYVKKLILNEKN